MAPSWSAELAECPISAERDEPDQGEHQALPRGRPGADAEERRRDDGSDDDHGQPGAAGFDVGHEVDQGTGEFRIPGDALPRDVRVAQHQHGNCRQRPTAPAAAASASVRVKAGCSGASVALDREPASERGQDSDGEEQPADHGGQRDVVDGFADRQAPADQRAGVGDPRAAAAPENSRAATSPRNSAARPANSQGREIRRDPQQGPSLPRSGSELALWHGDCCGRHSSIVRHAPPARRIAERPATLGAVAGRRDG